MKDFELNILYRSQGVLGTQNTYILGINGFITYS